MSSQNDSELQKRLRQLEAETNPAQGAEPNTDGGGKLFGQQPLAKQLAIVAIGGIAALIILRVVFQIVSTVVFLAVIAGIGYALYRVLQRR